MGISRESKTKKKSPKNYETLAGAMRNAKTGDTIFVNPPDNSQQANEIARASESSYIFQHGNRVYVRNMSDESLNDEYESIITVSGELRRELNLLESLQYNMSMEQKFRGLK